MAGGGGWPVGGNQPFATKASNVFHGYFIIIGRVAIASFVDYGVHKPMLEHRDGWHGTSTMPFNSYKGALSPTDMYVCVKHYEVFRLR